MNGRGDGVRESGLAHLFDVETELVAPVDRTHVFQDDPFRGEDPAVPDRYG